MRTCCKKIVRAQTFLKGMTLKDIGFHFAIYPQKEVVILRPYQVVITKLNEPCNSLIIIIWSQKRFLTYHISFEQFLPSLSFAFHYLLSTFFNLILFCNFSIPCLLQSSLSLIFLLFSELVSC